LIYVSIYPFCSDAIYIWKGVNLASSDMAIRMGKNDFINYFSVGSSPCYFTSYPSVSNFSELIFNAVLLSHIVYIITLNETYSCGPPKKKAFVRKVYSILGLQFGLTTIVALIFIFSDPIKFWVQSKYVRQIDMFINFRLK